MRLKGCIRGTYSCPSSAAFIQNTPNQFAGALYDTSTPPLTPTHDQVAAEAEIKFMLVDNELGG